MEDTSGKWSELSNSVTERDLVIMVSEDLSWEVQIDNVVKKANRTLGMLKRTFYSRGPRLWRNLYVAFVMPHLEYAVQAWNPRKRHNKN